MVGKEEVTMGEATTGVTVRLVMEQEVVMAQVRDPWPRDDSPITIVGELLLARMLVHGGRGQGRRIKAEYLGGINLSTGNMIHHVRSLPSPTIISLSSLLTAYSGYGYAPAGEGKNPRGRRYK